MVASVHRVKPHEVFDRHRTEPVLTRCWPLATRLRHSWSNLAYAPSRRTRASAGVAGPLVGSSALRALNPFGKTPFFKIRLKYSLASGRRKAGGIGIDGAPETTFAPSSKPPATCSTTWLGDHFPGARGVVQVAADLSAAATRSRTAARLAASRSLTSAMGPPVREPGMDLNEPRAAVTAPAYD